MLLRFSVLFRTVHSQWTGLYEFVTSPADPHAVVLWETSYFYASKPAHEAVKPLLAVGEIWRSLAARVEVQALGQGQLSVEVQALRSDGPDCATQINVLYDALNEARGALHMLMLTNPAVNDLALPAHGLEGLEDEANLKLWPRLYLWLTNHFLGACAAGVEASVGAHMKFLSSIELDARNLLMLVNAKLVRSRLAIPSSSPLQVRYATEDQPVTALRRYEVLHSLMTNKTRFIEIGTADLHTSLGLLKHRPNLTVIAVDPWAGRSHDDVQTLKRKLDPYPNAVALRHTGEEVPDIVKALGSSECFDAFFIDANMGEKPYFCFSSLEAWVKSGLICKGALIAGHDYRVGWEPSVAECAHTYANGRTIGIGHDWVWWFYMD